MTKFDALDLQTLTNLVELDDGGYGLVKEMLALFREDTPHRIQDILDAASHQDAEALSRAAHALKGGAGALGAKALRLFAADLEGLGRDGSAEVGKDLSAQLNAHYQAALTALDSFVQAGEGQG